MFLIKTNDGDYEFTIGEIRKKPLEIEDLASILSIIADKDELSYIHNCVSNIPYHRTNDPQIWTGEYARFIAANLFYDAGSLNSIIWYKGAPPQRHYICGFDVSGALVFCPATDYFRKLSLLEKIEYVVVHKSEVHKVVAELVNLPVVKTDSDYYIWVGDMARSVLSTCFPCLEFPFPKKCLTKLKLR